MLTLNESAMNNLIILKEDIMEIIEVFDKDTQSELKDLAAPIYDKIYDAELENKSKELEINPEQKTSRSDKNSKFGVYKK